MGIISISNNQRILDVLITNQLFWNIESSLLWIFEMYAYMIHFEKMERIDQRKPLTQEMKGSLITLYQAGHSYAEISERLRIHVSNFKIFNSSATNQNRIIFSNE